MEREKPSCDCPLGSSAEGESASLGVGGTLFQMRASKSLEKSLKPLWRAMETFARIDIFDLDDLGGPSTQGVDGMHTITTVTN